MDGLTISARAFGPIDEATVDLKPFTIFVGTNNTGKSYMAQLIYAIAQTNKAMVEGIESRLYMLPQYLVGTRYLPVIYSHPLEREELPLSKRTLNAFAKLLPADTKELMRKPPPHRRLSIDFDSLPAEMKDFIHEYLGNYLDMFNTELVKEIERCYDAKISNLVCRVGGSENLSISLHNKKPEIDLAFESQGNRLKEARKDFSLQKEVIQTILPRIVWREAVDATSEEKFRDTIVRRGAILTILNSYQNILGILPKKAYYLPAARSGILHGQKALARVGLRTLQRAGMEPISIPKLPGVVIDFLDAIYSIEKDERGDFSDLARKLETGLTAGRIEFVESTKELPEIYFREPVVGRLALHRTSSMISEMAPIILLLRYLVRKGDMIIIEEPESHMHPAAQRAMAVVLATLANRGANVLVTTHSDYLFQQIANLIALSHRTEERMKRWGYDSENLVSPDKVSAYLFSRESNECGSVANKLEVGEKGISEEEFGAVASAIRLLTCFALPEKGWL